MTIDECPCGSGETAEAFYDARGIYCGKLCPVCEEQKRAGFRPEVMNNPNYECDEQIEEDY